MGKPKRPEFEIVPKYAELVKPTFQALKNLGGSATVPEIHDEVIQIMNITEEVLQIGHPGKYESEYFYRLKWILTWMKNAGVIYIPKYNTREILSTYSKLDDLSDEQVKLILASTKNRKSIEKIEKITTEEFIGSDPDSTPWRDEIKQHIYTMNPYKFEDFCKVLLEACDIQDVKITQRSKDHGIDGIGKLRINEIFTIKVVFQCKRYQYNHSITSPDIDQFRGATYKEKAEMQLYITTSKFTADAIKNAIDSPLSEIHLMDIEGIVDKILAHKIGIKEEIYVPIIDKEFYSRFK